jgi:transposase InsO family protein
VPFKETTAMSELREFVRLASEPGANRRQLCRRFGISPQTGYKWLARHKEHGMQGLVQRSRRPLRSPKRSGEALEQAVLALREKYPVWGARKLRALLQQQAVEHVPSASTITEILRRHERLDGKRAGQPAAYQRFEHPAPNQLWQMDFKGHFPLMDGRGTRCHPLTLIDDHSRYSLCARACLDEREETVQRVLTDVFRRYGLPYRMTADNGSPWGNSNGESLTWLGAWIIRLGVYLSHSRPYHPQTQGKDERLHRTLNLELLLKQGFVSADDAQRGMDAWRAQYNHVRPHEALGLKPPVTRYQPSVRSFPEILPAIEYDSQDAVRIVQAKGEISFRGQEYLVGRGLRGLPVALRATEEEGRWDIYFCQQRLTPIRVQPRG